jgi:hypothetical protein
MAWNLQPAAMNLQVGSRTMNHRSTQLVGAVCVAALLGACAGSAERSGAAPPVASELAEARASISAAEQAGAAQYGSAELALAREKLTVAEREAEEGNVVRAQQLAVEADLDADLATAITRHRQTQLLAEEVDSGLRTLEEELRRGVDTQTRSSGSVGSAGELR